MLYYVLFAVTLPQKRPNNVPALLGCFSQGDTFEEERVNVEEAIALYVEIASERAARGRGLMISVNDSQ